jgi:hypothetical protein
MVPVDKNGNLLLSASSDTHFILDITGIYW